MAAAPGIGDRSYGIIALRYAPENSTSIPSFPTKSNSQVLLIHQKTLRRLPQNAPFWCFPKGHAEKTDPSLHATAIREFYEETGLVIKEDDFLLGDTQKFTEVYVNPLRNVGKEVRYWVVLLSQDEAYKEFRLQEKEVEDASWCTWDEALEKITFREGKEMFEGVIKALERGDAKL